MLRRKIVGFEADRNQTKTVSGEDQLPPIDSVFLNDVNDNLKDI